jgi:hypothetical protein
MWYTKKRCRKLAAYQSASRSRAEKKGLSVASERDVHSGSSFEDFLEAEGIREEVESAAIKRVIAWQFEQEMKRQRKTKRAMAAELRTSRSQLDRLLDPSNTAVSLDTLSRAAQVLGKRLVLSVEDRRTRSVRGRRPRPAATGSGRSTARQKSSGERRGNQEVLRG